MRWRNSSVEYGSFEAPMVGEQLPFREVIERGHQLALGEVAASPENHHHARACGIAQFLLGDVFRVHGAHELRFPVNRVRAEFTIVISLAIIIYLSIRESNCNLSLAE
jgi:hypothetical protein